MAFPATRHTLIHRLTLRAADSDWREFLNDYWGPICWFARRRGNLQADQAEDVASRVFEAIVKNRLLERWVDAPSAKLRTLICSVTINILANRARVDLGRRRLVREHGGMLDRYGEADAKEPTADSDDAFYAACADQIVQTAVDRLLAEYTAAGKGDYFRVLHGRICDEMTMPQIAEALQLKLTTVENYFRHARERLGEKLRDLVRQHVGRYSPPELAANEFALEWDRLGKWLAHCGGLEQTLRRVQAEGAGTAFRRKPPRLSRASLSESAPRGQAVQEPRPKGNSRPDLPG